jgi:membrane protease subunit (stomatin/prohibitin family)
MSAPRKCAECGKIFIPSFDDQVKCSDCAEKSKKSVMRDRTCRECGKTFSGGPRAWYCPECRTIRQKAAKQRYQSKGPSRALGSMDKCEICGKEYIVKSARQRYCPDCAEEAVKKADNAQGREYMQEYRKTRQRKTTRFCVLCGQPIPDGRQKYCSDACLNASAKESQRKTEERRGKKVSSEPLVFFAEQSRKTYPRLCQQCRTVFYAESSSAKFCPNCANQRRSQQQRDTARRNSYNWTEEEISRGYKIPVCQICGKPFMGDSRAQFCNHCYAMRLRRRKKWRLKKKNLPPDLRPNGAFEFVKYIEDKSGKSFIRARCKKCGRVIVRPLAYYYRGFKSCGCSQKRAAKPYESFIPGIQTCENCGKKFSANTYAIWCPECRETEKKNFIRGYLNRRFGYIPHDPDF